VRSRERTSRSFWGLGARLEWIFAGLSRDPRDRRVGFRVTIYEYISATQRFLCGYRIVWIPNHRSVETRFIASIGTADVSLWSSPHAAFIDPRSGVVCLSLCSASIWKTSPVKLAELGYFTMGCVPKDEAGRQCKQ